MMLCLMEQVEQSCSGPPHPPLHLHGEVFNNSTLSICTFATALLAAYIPDDMFSQQLVNHTRKCFAMQSFIVRKIVKPCTFCHFCNKIKQVSRFYPKYHQKSMFSCAFGDFRVGKKLTFVAFYIVNSLVFKTLPRESFLPCSSSPSMLGQCTVFVQ